MTCPPAHGLPLPPFPPGPPGSDTRSRHVGFLLKQVHHMLNAAVEEAMREQGINLTFPRAVALVSLLENDGLSNAALARAALVSPQTMHEIVQRLAQDGLVERSADPAHGRARRTTLTAAGRDLLARGVTVSEPVFERMLDGLDADARDTLVGLLAHCIGNLSAASPRR